MRWFFVGLLVLCSGCGTAPTVVVDPRVEITPNTGVILDRIQVNAIGPVRGNIRLINTTGTDLPIKQTTTWFNSIGQNINTLLSRPEKMIVPRFGDAYVELIAPTPDAMMFQVRVEADYTD
jgi:hypothetical protein